MIGGNFELLEILVPYTCQKKNSVSQNNLTLQKAQQMEMEQNTAVEPEEAWYKDETDDFQEKLMDYHHR